MADEPENIRNITDILDSAGNVTKVINYFFELIKANTKGYSVATASLACFLMFGAFIDEINFISVNKLTSVDITIPEVFIGGITN